MERFALVGLALCAACGGGAEPAWHAPADSALVAIDGSVVISMSDGRVTHLASDGERLGGFTVGTGQTVVAASGTESLVWDPDRGGLDVVDPDGTVRWSALSAGSALVSAAVDDRGVVAVVTSTDTTQTFAAYEPDGTRRFARTFAPDPTAVALVSVFGDVRMAMSTVTVVFDAMGTTVATLPSGTRARYDRDGGGLRLDIHADMSTLVERVDAEGHILWSKAFEKRTPTVALLSNGEAVVEVVAPEVSEHSFLRIARDGKRFATTPAGEAAVIGGDSTGFYTLEDGELRRYEDADQ